MDADELSFIILPGNSMGVCTGAEAYCRASSAKANGVDANCLQSAGLLLFAQFNRPLGAEPLLNGIDVFLELVFFLLDGFRWLGRNQALRNQHRRCWDLMLADAGEASERWVETMSRILVMGNVMVKHLLKILIALFRALGQNNDLITCLR